METIILMLVRNEEKTIERALKSVIDQDDVEIYLVDDASTDQTMKIALSILTNSGVDFRVKTNQHNMGVVESADKAFQALSRRDCFLIRLDGDDELPPDAIKNLKKGWSNNSFVAGPYIEVQEKTSKIITPNTIYKCLAGGVLMRIKDILNVGGFAKDNIGVFIEYDLYARLIDNGYQPTFISQPTYVYHRRSNSITANKMIVDDSLKSLSDIWGEKLVSQIRKY